jgi:hypothetical protein
MLPLQRMPEIEQNRLHISSRARIVMAESEHPQ